MGRIKKQNGEIITDVVRVVDTADGYVRIEKIGGVSDKSQCKALKAGETIDWALALWLRKPDQVITGDLTFKLGFKASFCQGSWATGDLKILKEKTYWSGPITVKVQ